MALCVELQQFTGHVGHGLLDARLGLLPGLGAEFVELRRGPGVGAAILLDQVEARKRDVKLGLVGKLKDHEFERRLVMLFDDAQTAVTGDAVLDVNDVIADSQIAKVGDKCGGLGLAAGDGAGLDVSVVDQILRAEEDELTGGGTAVGVAEVEHLDAIGDGGLDDDRSAQVTGEIAGLRIDGGAARGLRARAETIGHLVLLQETGETFDLALIRRGDENTRILLRERVNGLDQSGDIAVEALGGAGGEVDLGELGPVRIQNVDSAELVKFEAGITAQPVVQIPGRDVDVIWPDE